LACKRSACGVKLSWSRPRTRTSCHLCWAYGLKQGLRVYAAAYCARLLLARRTRTNFGLADIYKVRERVGSVLHCGQKFAATQGDGGKEALASMLAELWRILARASSGSGGGHASRDTLVIKQTPALCQPRSGDISPLAGPSNAVISCMLGQPRPGDADAVGEDYKRRRGLRPFTTLLDTGPKRTFTGSSTSSPCLTWAVVLSPLSASACLDCFRLFCILQSAPQHASAVILHHVRSLFALPALSALAC